MAVTYQPIVYVRIMKKHVVLSIMFLVCATAVIAQSDSTKVLSTVVVNAYAQNTSLKETPAAVGYIDAKQLNRFNNTSILPAINTIPGVRMEERSPGSYRISVRGSSLRSPFGVRNVKVYYNDIPFTDPAGHTYFNQLGFYNFQSLEVIKGPGSSLYGAGTGGVMLVKSQHDNWKPGAQVAYTLGSFNTHNASAEIRFGNEQVQNTLRYQQLNSDGYRQHTNMQSDVLSWDANLVSGQNNSLDAYFLFSDLYYQTPGALTKAEYDANPRMHRPAAGAFRSAAEAKAAIYEQTFIAGFTNRHMIAKGFDNATTLYGAYSQLRNPTIQNYSHNIEPHFGGRTVFTNKFRIRASSLHWTYGGEIQQGYATVKTYQNRNGNPDTLQFDDKIDSRQYFGFAQLAWSYRKFTATGGLSLNRQHISFARLSALPYSEKHIGFNNELAPRLAVLYRPNKDVSVYTNIAKGFSPPTTAELIPSGGIANLSLAPEYGWNYELGSKGSLFHKRLDYDVSAFLFELNNTIVVRRDAGGGNYFINAGNTKQTGIEASLNYRLLNESSRRFFGPVNTWASYSYYHFRYRNFTQLQNDFSGNKLPGVAPHTLTLGLDLTTRPGICLNLTHNYTGRIPLTDGNTAYANAYNVLSARAGYKRVLRKYSIDLFAGGDNLLNEQYSLGNDINGFNGRHYNAAPGINFFAGLSVAYSR